MKNEKFTFNNGFRQASLTLSGSIWLKEIGDDGTHQTKNYISLHDVSELITVLQALKRAGVVKKKLIAKFDRIHSYVEVNDGVYIVTATSGVYILEPQGEGYEVYRTGERLRVEGTFTKVLKWINAQL